MKATLAIKRQVLRQATFSYVTFRMRLIDGLTRHSRQMGMTYSQLAQDWLKKGLISARLEALIEGHKPRYSGG